MSDIQLTIDNITKNFDLAIEKGNKLFAVVEEPIIPLRELSDVPSYGDLPPEKILAFVQDNWRGGMGQKNKFRVGDMYGDGQNIDTREPNLAFLAGKINTINIADTIIGMEFFDGKEYAFSATKVYKLKADGTAWDTVLPITEDTIECLSQYDGKIFCGLTTGKYHYSTTGDVDEWTQCTLSHAVAHVFCVAPPFVGTKDILVLATRPNIVRTAIAPLNATASTTWVGSHAYSVDDLVIPTDPNGYDYKCTVAGTSDSSEPTWPKTMGTTVKDGGVTWTCVYWVGWLDPPYYIGDENSNITSLFILNGTLFVGKEDGLYALPVDGRPVAVMPEFRHKRDSTNFKYWTHWQSIFYGSLAGDIVEIIGGSSLVFSVDYMGPLERSPELAMTGSVKGMAADDKNIYAVLSIGSDYIIYTGRERWDNRYGLRWEWVPYIHLGTNACGAIKVMQRTGENPRLWFAYGTKMAYVILSRSPNYPLGDNNYQFCPQGYITTSYFDANYDTWGKIFCQFWITADDIVANHQYIRVYYQKDADTSWTLLSIVDETGVQSFDLAALYCKRIRLKVELNTDDSTKTPIVRMFILRGVLRPEITRSLDLVVVLGQSDMRKPSLDLEFLRTGRTAVTPVTLKDLRFGTTRYVTFLSNSPMEIETIDEQSKQPSYRARILAQELNWSPP